MFLTLTNKTPGTKVDINMDRVESFCLAQDALGGTKVYLHELQENEEYWRVKETPEQIREMLNSSTDLVDVAQKTAPRTGHPIGDIVGVRDLVHEHVVDGIPVSHADIMNAVRLQRGSMVKENRDSKRLDKLEKYVKSQLGVGLYEICRRQDKSEFRIDQDDNAYSSLRSAIDALKD